MFATLLESGTTLRHRPGVVSLSAVVHLALIAGGIMLSPPRIIEEPITEFVDRLTYTAAVLQGVELHSRSRGFGRMSSATPHLSPPDLSGIVVETNTVEVPDERSLFSGSDTGSGLSGISVPPGGQIYTATFVESPALALPGNRAPVYPDALRNAGVEGSVMVQFVIDSTGVLEPQSLRVLTSDHELFTESVRAVLHRHRFLPAEVRGRPVRMLVQQRFEFTVEH